MEEELTAEQTAAAEEQAAFTAGFNGTDQEPAVEVVAEPVIEDVEEVVTDEPAEKPLTIEDLRAIIEEQKQQNIAHTTKLSGQIGELKQRQMQIDAAKASVAGLSPKVRENLEQNFPELVPLFFIDDDEPTPAAPVKAEPVIENDEPTSQFTPEQIIERRLLTRDHKDWETLVLSPEVTDWRTKNLTAEENQTFETVWDADFVSGVLTRFKEASKPAAPVGKKVNTALAAAVTPRGTPRTAVAGPGADDEETAAFKASFKKPR